MIAGLLVLGAQMLAATTARAPSAGLPCIKVAERAVASAGFRPIATMSCTYDEAGLSRRLLSMLSLAEGRLSIKAIERTFSLPPLTTSYDHPRDAAYLVEIDGYDKTWGATLTFSERFYPLDAPRRPRFRSGGRPTLLNPRLHGERAFGMTLRQGSGGRQGQVCALSADQVVRYAQGRRWRAETIQVMPTDGVPPHPVTNLHRGGSMAGYDADGSGCVTGLTLIQSADRGAT